MSIKVRYFASLREQMGREEDELDFEDLNSVTDVWARVSTEALPPNTLVSVNQEYARPDAKVTDGDEVAFFPPVTGG